VKYDPETELRDAIREWADGSLPLMAGAELLIRSGWAERIDGSGYVEWSDNPHRKYAYPKVGEFLQSAGYLSGGEYRQIVTIASFLGQLVRHSNDKEALATPYEMQLYEMLPGVDHSFTRLTATAILLANGVYQRWPDA
jgi:hypothetical protein